jgi:hypothetical protein
MQSTSSWAGVARIGRIAAGTSLVIAGLALLILPGPGIPLLLAGLALLARDLPWAGRVRQWLVARLTPMLEWARRVIFRRRPR